MARLSFASFARRAVALAFALPALATAASVSNTVLIFARDAASGNSGSSGLQGYGIPFQTVIVPSGGVTLPTLNSSATAGNYGSIVVVGEVSYDYGGTFRSALTDAQWNQLYAYQASFGVRMVRLDVYPGPNFGANALGGTAEDQPIYFSNATAFRTASLKTGTGAQMTTAGLYHYPAQITNSTLATEIAQFAAGGGYPVSSAAVINNFGNRQQMVFFLPFATEWSATSNFLQHAWIHWATRGLYNGFRRTYFGTQVDDMFLATEIYQGGGTEFRVRTGDLDAIKAWIPQIQAKMPSGSSYIMEIAHNGNGDIEAAIAKDTAGTTCNPNEAIEYDEQVDTPLEFKKDLGTGTDIWPPTPSSYAWSATCARLDDLQRWWATPANRDVFAHVSHTFSHSGLNNATFSDANKEITFNIAWLRQIGFASAKYWSPKGLVPPAITGLHNGDAIRAFINNGIVNVVGDNTRPPLRNANTFWPLISNVNDNGYAGLNIIPRWATTIYYNCDTPTCTLNEWVNTSGGSGDFQNLLKDARVTNSRNLLGLHWDPFMFHQANLRYTDMPSTVVNGVSQKLSLIQIWVETVVNEMTRLTSWPMVTLKHDDIAAAFLNRMTRDNCNPKLTWNTSADGKTITSATLTANGNRCGTPIPVTFPGTVTSANGGRSEQLGSDPLTIWATLNGQAQTFTLSTPIAV